MPTMWFAKDGARPHTQSGFGTEITFDEVEAVFGSHQLHYAGPEAPNINASKPSHSNKNVVLEVEQAEGSFALLPRQGFYIVVGCSPGAAERALTEHRGAV